MREQNELAKVAEALNDELTIIVNCVDRARAAMEPGDPAQAWLAQISDAARRCSWNTAQLLRTAGQMDKTRSAVIQMPAVEFDRPLLDRILREFFGQRDPQL